MVVLSLQAPIHFHSPSSQHFLGMAGWGFSTPKFDSELLKDCLIDLVQLGLGAKPF